MARGLGAAAVVLALVVVACGGSEPEEASPPATEPPATEAPATEASTPPATATQPPATQTPTPRPATSTPAAAPEEPEEGVETDLEIVTLLPPDAIPAINNPIFISLEEADRQLRLTDLVIGVSIDGEHRAYGAAFLSAHEIVNDTLGGRAIAVTW